MGCHHDAEEHGADLRHESVAVRCVEPEGGSARGGVCWYKSRNRAYSTHDNAFQAIVVC